jgi:6-phosphogluconolactonase
VPVSPDPVIHVLDDPQRRCAEILAEQASRGGSIVLTGGTAVGPAYTTAARLEPNWRKVTLWWGDERCVRPSDPRSNFLLARETLLDRLLHLPGDVRRIRGEADPVAAAAEYDTLLRDATLDLLLLGLGPDGHCASLFPGSPQLDVEDRLATSGPPGLEPLVERVTLTLPALRSARRIVFIALGESKADAVAAAFSGDVSHDVPASLVRLAGAPVEVLVDQAAAARL